jgi:4-hydroxyphenylpyruvate dioxygenase
MSVLEVSPAESSNRAARIQLQTYHHIQLYVGNAYQAMQFFRRFFGFSAVAYAGLETGSRNRVSYALTQGDIRLVLTSPLDPAGPMANEIRMHGDSVKDIAFSVSDVDKVFNSALLRGAVPLAEPFIEEDDRGQIKTAAIRSCGDIIHSFVQRNGYEGAFLPGFQALPGDQPSLSAGLLEIDHVALSLPEGRLDEAAEFYRSVLDLEITHVENIVTEYSAMNSKVVQNKEATVKFPMLEPAASKRASQIQEYLNYNGGPGVQHLACSCKDIIWTVSQLRQAGVEFLKTPNAYYELLAGRVGSISQDAAILRSLNILVDRDEWGYLLQIFSKPITSRPTLFLEVIQREGAHGFGSGNIRALYDAVEREQAKRGNL